MNKPRAEYLKTLPEVSERFGVTEKTLHAWRKRGLHFPVKTRNGYNAEEFKRRLEEFATARQASEEEEKSADPRERKLQLECERLVVNIKIDDERLKQAEIETRKQQAQVVSMECHRETMDYIRAMYLDGLNQIVESVSTKARSAKVRELLQAAVDGLRKRIADTANG